MDVGTSHCLSYPADKTKGRHFWLHATTGISILAFSRGFLLSSGRVLLRHFKERQKKRSHNRPSWNKSCHLLCFFSRSRNSWGGCVCTAHLKKPSVRWTMATEALILEFELLRGERRAWLGRSRVFPCILNVRGRRWGNVGRRLSVWTLQSWTNRAAGFRVNASVYYTDQKTNNQFKMTERS